MRKGFTMIELIFVIVIIGILAAIAIPKLSATRDDAKIVSSVQNLATCINDIGASYTATGNEATGPDAADPAKGYGYASCKQVSNDKCFKVELGGSKTDGNITVTGKQIGDQWCTDAAKSAFKKNLVGDANGAAKDHQFGGSKIKF